jgi:hypothetical protein
MSKKKELIDSILPPEQAEQVKEKRDRLLDRLDKALDSVQKRLDSDDEKKA